MVQMNWNDWVIFIRLAKRFPQSQAARRLYRQTYSINHLGEQCWVNNEVLCQEGYCCNCEIWEVAKEAIS